MNKFKGYLLRSAVAALAIGCSSISLFAAIKPASLFTDNMVLQQKSNVPVWGWAKEAATVKVSTSWNHKTYTTKADQSGKWKLTVSTPAAGGPYEITMSDGQAITLKNILIGEVWICGGQSNMEMPVKGFKGLPIFGSNDDILHSGNDKIRVYTVPRSSITEKQENSKASAWKIAGPESISKFSATAYYFGRMLSEMLHVPVGLINDSYSGASIEAWTSPQLLKSFPDIKVPSKGDSIKEVSRTPTTLYNGMLYPVTGFGIRGAIWYQGESNYERPDQYEALLPAMVKEWRSSWGMGEFPFYFVQIAPYGYDQVPGAKTGGKYNSAFLRDAQRKSVNKIPNSGMAVLMDIGEEKSIHPAEKKTVGTRLAYLALAQTYLIKGFGYASPAYESLTIKGNAAVIKFLNSPNGLTSFDKPLNLFEIAGADKKFYPAQAKISGSSVTVSSAQVAIPVAVRYAFKDFVKGDLFNTEGLPASSFRTDDWEN